MTGENTCTVHCPDCGKVLSVAVSPGLVETIRPGLHSVSFIDTMLPRHPCAA